MKQFTRRFSLLWMVMLIITGCSNEPPVAIIEVDKQSGVTPLDVSFRGSESFDPDADGSIVSYSWEFPDQIKSGAIVSKQFTEPGNYKVILTVTDNRDAIDTSSINISVISNENSIWGTVQRSLDAIASSDYDAFRQERYENWFNFGNIDTPPFCSSGEAIADMRTYLQNNTISLSNMEIHETQYWGRLGMVRYSMNLNVVSNTGGEGFSGHVTYYDFLYKTDEGWKLVQHLEVVNDDGIADGETTTEAMKNGIQATADSLHYIYIDAVTSLDADKDTLTALLWVKSFMDYYWYGWPDVDINFVNCSDKYGSDGMYNGVLLECENGLDVTEYEGEISHTKIWEGLAISLYTESLTYPNRLQVNREIWVWKKNSEGRFKAIMGITYPDSQ